MIGVKITNEEEENVKEWEDKWFVALRPTERRIAAEVQAAQDGRKEYEKKH